MNIRGISKDMYKRLISLDKTPSRSFFLWGSRQTGKSTLLNHLYPDALKVDLLKSEEFAKYGPKPHLLREKIKNIQEPVLVVIDEIQKIPALLDDVHWLIENTPHTFALSGSSARKLKRTQANMLGGRALRYELYGLVSKELGDDFDLVKLLNRGYLPSHYLASEKEIKKLISSYVGDYLKEEIVAEALVRNLNSFSDFLEKAALSDTELIVLDSFARDVGISASTIKEYFSILCDTLFGYYLPAYKKKPKRRTISAPKFYFGNIAIVNHLAQRGYLEPKSPLFGKAFENWIAHELRAYNSYYDKFQNISYWRLTTGVEVDFIVGSTEIVLACEAKASPNIHADHLKGLRELSKEYSNIRKKVVVSLEDFSKTTDDGIEILSVNDFRASLWSGKLF